MPVESSGRAVAIITQPLDAEVLADGVWLPGAVLGWRHDEAGRCRAEVRLVDRGAEQVRWVELAAVRLPGAGIVPASSPTAPSTSRGRAPRQRAAETVMMSRAELRGRMAAGLPARSAGPRRRHASDLTAELPAVRCDEAEGASGRHRAPRAAGRHRADASPPGAGAEMPTRAIRLGDLAGWSWEGSATARR